MAEKQELEVNLAESYPEGHEFNLSDFALFLSVMKIPRAYECALSIILDEPDVKMAEVKVEQVILNEFGKRAIRLDAWGRTRDDRQINMEMENHASRDDIKKRSRFYQGLMDTPVLKSGKRTKYKHLPSTIIIFITQEDLFGKDLAKYTFTEQCEEITGLHLEDGTTKLFLNMTSKNGSKELVSLLQYMKNTSLSNPDVKVKDNRIIELDRIVTEVKESEEWEAVQMDILEIGMTRGVELGMEKGIPQGEYRKLVSQVCKKIKKGVSASETAEMLEEDEKTIQEIYLAAEKFAPEYDVDQVIDALKNNKAD